MLVQVAKHLFNATVEAADGEVPVWDPSVRFFRLYRNGELKGHFYLDSFARPGGALWDPCFLTAIFTHAVISTAAMQHCMLPS